MRRSTHGGRQRHGSTQGTQIGARAARELLCWPALWLWLLWAGSKVCGRKFDIRVSDLDGAIFNSMVNGGSCGGFQQQAQLVMHVIVPLVVP